MRKLFFAGLILVVCTLSSTVNAMQHELTEKLNFSGEEQRVVFSPFLVSDALDKKSDATEYMMYEISYNELKRQIAIYQTIYVTGQLLHGYLMIKMKPKFVD